MKKRVLSVFLILIITVSVMAGCKKSTAPTSTMSITTPIPTGVEGTAHPIATIPELSDITPPATAVSGDSDSIESDTVITLSDGNIKIEGEGASAKASELTITKSGKYLISGSLSNGVIYINTTDENNVKLYLNGADIHNSNGPALYILSAPKKVVISTVKDSVNLISDGSQYSEDSFGNSPDSAIFSKDDVKFEGNGSLYVTGNYDKAIHGKDDLTVESGNIYTKSAGDGISGKNSIEITGGGIYVDSGKDGLVSNRNEEGKDPGVISISGGVIQIKTGGGSENAPEHTENDFGGGGRPGDGGRPGGGGRPWSADDSVAAAADSSTEESKKGIKAVGKIVISGGDITVDSYDDALHCDTDIEISNGTMNFASGDDGIHSDVNVTISGGTLSITKSYEGVEGQYITVCGGSVCVVASDDGANATDGSGSSMGGGFGGMGSGQDCSLKISGGYLFINASGDGLDSNGDIIQTGGEVIVFGPTNSGNGAIDFGDGNNSYTITGGSVLAVGASGMAEGVETGGDVSTFNVRTNNISGGTLIYVTDSTGKCVLAFESPKQFSSIVYASSTISSGKYTFYQGGSCEGECINGVYISPAPSGGTSLGEIEI